MEHAQMNLPNWLTHATHAPVGFNPFQGPARSLADTPPTSSSSSSSGPIVLTHPPHGLNYVPWRPARPKAIDNWLQHPPPPGSAHDLVPGSAHDLVPGFASRIAVNKSGLAPTPLGTGPKSKTYTGPRLVPRLVPPPPKPKASGGSCCCTTPQRWKILLVGELWWPLKSGFFLD